MSMPHIRAAYRLSIDARRVTQELTQTPMEITDRALLDRIGPRSRKCARLEAFLDLRHIREILAEDQRPLPILPVLIELALERRGLAFTVALQRPHVENASLGIGSLRDRQIPEHRIHKPMKLNEFRKHQQRECGNYERNRI